MHYIPPSSRYVARLLICQVFRALLFLDGAKIPWSVDLAYFSVKPLP